MVENDNDKLCNFVLRLNFHLLISTQDFTPIVMQRPYVQDDAASNVPIVSDKINTILLRQIPVVASPLQSLAPCRITTKFDP
jgi:hypothetical protein